VRILFASHFNHWFMHIAWRNGKESAAMDKCVESLTGTSINFIFTTVRVDVNDKVLMSQP